MPLREILRDKVSHPDLEWKSNKKKIKGPKKKKTLDAFSFILVGFRFHQQSTRARAQSEVEGKHINVTL